MKEKFEELHKILTLDRQKSQWSKERTLHERALELQNEVNEIFNALENKDMTNLKEELGDVIWDAVAIAVIAEEEGFFDTKEVLSTVIKKFKQRKPWIFTGEDLNPEEESRRWREAKRQEKNERNRS